MQQMTVDLGFNEDEVDEQHDKVVLDVLVAEAAAVLAHSEADIVAARRIACARVLRPQRLDRVPAFDADRHFVLLFGVLMKEESVRSSSYLRERSRGIRGGRYE